MKIYGIEHFIYVLVVLLISIPSLILLKKYMKTESQKNRTIKIVALILLISIVSNRVTICLNQDDLKWYHFLPNQYCGLSSFVLSLSVLLGKKNNNFLHFVWFLALLGGVVTLIYPDFLPQDPSFFYGPTITGLLHHTIAVYMVIVLFMFNYITIIYKKWYCTILGFTCYFSYGAFLITNHYYSDSFHMLTPILSGTNLTAWVMAPIYLVVYSIILFIVEIIRRGKAK